MIRAKEITLDLLVLEKVFNIIQLLSSNRFLLTVQGNINNVRQTLQYKIKICKLVWNSFLGYHNLLSVYCKQNKSFQKVDQLFVNSKIEKIEKIQDCSSQDFKDLVIDCLERKKNIKKTVFYALNH